MAALTRRCPGGSAHALTTDQAEMLFAEADTDEGGTIDIDEFAATWAEFDAQYGMTKMVKEQKKGGKKGGAGKKVKT